jgi:DNA-binding PadR family transcriptional regulator
MMHEMARAWFRHGHGHGRGFRGVWGLGYHKDWGGWRAGWIQPMRRGEVKFVVLEVLAEGPKHGYEIITAIEQRRNVRPSAGSIYPTLQMLEDGGFVTSADVDGKRTYTITDAGLKLLANRANGVEEDTDDELDPHHRLKESAVKLGAAVMNVRGSDDKAIDRVREILDKARKEIYGILASDEA